MYNIYAHTYDFYIYYFDRLSVTLGERNLFTAIYIYIYICIHYIYPFDRLSVTLGDRNLFTSKDIYMCVWGGGGEIYRTYIADNIFILKEENL